MKTIKSVTASIALLLILSSIAYGQQLNPPPEAYKACEGKNIGDASQFVNPSGETVKGTCEELDGKLILRPDRLKGKSGGRSFNPPPEAYKACEGKNIGDTSQFVNPRGETVKGTCDELDGKLILRPDRLKGKSGGRSFNPPPEAYKACEGKNIGDASQFVNPSGETVKGTCEELDGKLILRPDRSGRKSGNMNIPLLPNISYANVDMKINNINNRLYVTDRGSNKIDIYNLNTLKLSDSIILDEAINDVLRIYIDEQESLALLNSKSMTKFKILDLNKKCIKCQIVMDQSSIGWFDVKNKQIIQLTPDSFILYDYDCKLQKTIHKNGTIISKTSESGHIGFLRERDLQVNLLDLANGNIIDSFSIYNGSHELPRHNMLLSDKWFVANFDRKLNTDIVFYDRNTQKTSWINIPGSVIAPALKPVYLVNDLYYQGINDNGHQVIAVIDLKNKKVLNKIPVDNDTISYSVDSTGVRIYILNKSGGIKKKSVNDGNKSSIVKPLNFGVMLHLEGQLGITNEAEYLRINSELKQIIDLFSKYDAKITIESEMPYAEAADKWGNNMLLYALKNGHGVGTHCDFDSMSQEEATTNYKSRKEKIDSIVGAENNLGCSGGWGKHDWAQAAYSAGFSYLDAPVMIAYLAVPEKNRPINPDTGKNYTDTEIAPGSGLYYHDSAPPEIEDAIYPRRLKDTNDLIGGDSGVVLIPGSLGEISSLYEGRKNCSPRCSLTEDDTDYIFKNIDYVNSIKNDSKVASLYLHFPIFTIDLPPSKKEMNLKIVVDWLKRMQEYQNQGKIKWKTMKEIYEEYKQRNQI